MVRKVGRFGIGKQAAAIEGERDLDFGLVGFARDGCQTAGAGVRGTHIDCVRSRYDVVLLGEMIDMLASPRLLLC